MVERHVANVNVEGSTPFTRSFAPSQPDGVFCRLFPPDRVLITMEIRRVYRRGAEIVVPMLRRLDKRLLHNILGIQATR